MQSDYPIDFLLDFIGPDFQRSIVSGYGWGQSIALLSSEIAIVQKFMRGFLIEWIDSGLRDDGERPFERNFAPRQRKKIEPGSPIFEEAPNTLRVLARFFHGTLLIRDQHYYIVGRQEGSGNVGVAIGPTGGWAVEPTLPQDHDLETLAVSFFLGFYRSDWIYRLMHCRRCGGFWKLSRNPRRCYAKGWHCRPCGKNMAGLDGTQKTRADRLAYLLALAGHAYLTLSRVRKMSKERQIIEIRSRVNTTLRRGEAHITRHWVTYHYAEIQREAEWLSSGTSSRLV